MNSPLRVVVDWPPNIAEIQNRFPQAGRETVFTYGDVLYSPAGLPIAPHLMAHEEVHRLQQAAMGKETWWARYLFDPAFVLEQEIPAFKAQYQAFCALHHNRGLRLRFLRERAGSLSGPLYGRLIGFGDAMRLIRGGRRGRAPRALPAPVAATAVAGGGGGQ